MSPAAVQPREGTLDTSNGCLNDLNGGHGSEPEAAGIESSSNGGRDSPAGCGHEHFAMKIVDETFNLGIDEVFTMLFSDSQLFRDFIKRRRTYDVKLADWPKDFDEEGKKVRQIYYTLSINYSIGPKFSPSSERQILQPESQPGKRYLVDAECVNGGVPYSDHFYTLIRYCITQPAPGLTRLVITGQVMYLKSVFGFIKGLLQKTAVSGLSESFGVMAELLRQESDGRILRKGPSSAQSRPVSLPLPSKREDDNRAESPGSASSQTPMAPNRRHRRDGSGGGHRKRRPSTAIASEQESEKTTVKNVTGVEKTNFLPRDFDVLYLPVDHMELLIILLFIVVLALVFINAALYYQVSALESTLVRSFVHRHDDRPFL